MGIYLGNSTGSYYVGSNPVAAMYMGDTLAWVPGGSEALFFYIDASVTSVPYDLTLNSGTGSLRFGAVHTTVSGVPTWSFPAFSSEILFTHTDSMNVNMQETNFGASFWTQKGNTTTNVELVNKGTNYRIEFGGSSTIGDMELQAQAAGGSGTTLDVNMLSAGSVTTWYHYAYSLVYGGGNLYQFTVYRDGVFQGTTTYNSPSYANFGTVTNTGNMVLKSQSGYLQYLKLFKKALTPEEVSLEYNSTKDRFA